VQISSGAASATSQPVSASNFYQPISVPEVSGPKQDELLVIIGGENGRISIVDPNSMPTPFAVTHPTGWDLAAHGVSISSLRDVEVTDIDGDSQAEVLLLFPDRVVVLTGGTTPSSTSFEVFPLSMSRQPRVIAARKLLGASTRTIYVACDGTTSVPLRSFDWTGTTWAFTSEVLIAAAGVLSAAPELTDLVDGQQWGLVLSLEGGRDIDPPIPKFMTSQEALVGAIVTIADAAGNPTVLKETSIFPGGARRLAVRDLGPATPQHVLSAIGTTIIEATSSSTDGLAELLVLGDGPRGAELFRVGDEGFRIPRRLGQIALFQANASHNALGVFRPTSLWRLASPLDADVKAIENEPDAQSLVMLDRMMHTLAFGQLDDGPEPEILTVDTANGELIALRVQPLPCATVVTGFVHGHQGQPAQMTPFAEFTVDESVDVAAAGTTEHIRRANEARRPGRPYDQNDSETVEHCPIRNLEIRGHWEVQTGGSVYVPLYPDDFGIGIALSGARFLATAAQYGVGEGVLVDTSTAIPPYLSGLLPGGLVLAANVNATLGMLLSGFDPTFYGRSLFLLAFSPATVEHWGVRVFLDWASHSLEQFSRGGYRQAHGPVVVDLSAALDESLILVRKNVDACDTSVLIDLTGHSRGTPTIMKALNRRSMLASFPHNALSRFNVGVHVNLLDVIDENHPWPLEWPWAHGGKLIGDGVVMRVGNERISEFTAASFDYVEDLDEALNAFVNVYAASYFGRGGTMSGGKFDLYRPMSHSVGAPVGAERGFAFASTFADWCATSGNEATCARYVAAERTTEVQMPHAPLFYWASSLPNPYLPNEPAQFAEPTQFLNCDPNPQAPTAAFCTADPDCAPRDVHRQTPMTPPGPWGSVGAVVEGMNCITQPFCDRPENFCYARSSGIGKALELPRGTGGVGSFIDSVPYAQDESQIGWAPEGGAGVGGQARVVYARTWADEYAFLPPVCGGGFDGDYTDPSPDVLAVPGVPNAGVEFVPDWDFMSTGNVVSSLTSLPEDALREPFLGNFPWLTTYIEHVQEFAWVDGLWTQDSCIYDSTNPCPAVIARGDPSHLMETFHWHFGTNLLEGIDVATLNSLSPNDQLQAILDEIDSAMAGMPAAEQAEYTEYINAIVGGQSGLTELYATFPLGELGLIQSNLDIRSRQYTDFLVRVDVEFTNSAGYIDVFVAGENLAETRRITAASSGLERTQMTFTVSRNSTVPRAGLPDLVAIEGKDASLYSVSVRPHRVFEAPTGRLYEFVVLPNGVSWEHARAVATRSKYFGLDGRLADPVDVATVTALANTLTPHLPVWVGAHKASSDYKFVRDNDLFVDSEALLTQPPTTHPKTLYAYLAPGDTLLSHRTNSLRIGDDEMAFVIEYDPIPETAECLDDVLMRSHWPLSSADAAGPVIDVKGGTHLGLRTGPNAQVSAPLAGTTGHSLNFLGGTSFRSSFAPTALLHDFISGQGSVSIWIKPATVSGTQVLFSIGGLLQDPPVFPSFMESPAKNVVFQLQRTGDELRVIWEIGYGQDFSVTTSGLDLVPGQTYQVVISRFNSPVIAGRVDMGVFVSKPGEGRVFEQAYFDRLRPNGTQASSAAVSLAGDWGTNRFVGAIDAVRVWRQPLTSVDAWRLFEGETSNEACGF
jgi:hypothetical protein